MEEMTVKRRVFFIYAIGWLAGSLAAYLVDYDWGWDVLGVVAIVALWFIGHAISKIIGLYDA
jgi:hypothetical protein